MRLNAAFLALATGLFDSTLAVPTLFGRQVLAPPPSDINVTIPDIPLDLVAPPLPDDLDNVVFDVAASTAKEVSDSKASLTSDLSDALTDSKQDGHQRRQETAPTCGASTIPFSAWPAGARGASADQFIGKNGTSAWTDIISAASTPDASKWTQVAARSDDQYLSYSVGSVPGPTAINTLQSYDPAACAAKCASNSLCRSFGIWIERTPCSSTNQEPAYQAKCIQYSFNIQTGDLNNHGQWAGAGGKFYRTQTGVKAYNMKDFVPPAVTGFNRPTTSDSALRVTSPEDVVKNWGFSYDILQRDPSTAIPDPNICAKQCADINAAGPVDEVKKSCNAFQLVHLTKTDAQSPAYQRAYGFICRFFTDVPSGTASPPSGLSVDSGYFYTASKPISPSILQTDPSTGCNSANQRVKTGIWSYYNSRGAGKRPWQDADGNDVYYGTGASGSWYLASPAMKGSFLPDYITYSTSVGAVKTEWDRRIAATWTGYPDADIVDDRFAVEDTYYLYTGTKAGTWTLQLDQRPDDATSMWIGPNALTPVRRDDASKPTAVDGSWVGENKLTASYALPVGRFIPVRSFFAQWEGGWYYKADVTFTPSDGSAPISVVSRSGIAPGMVYSQSCNAKTAPEIAL